jgi:hypothetical protein
MRAMAKCSKSYDLLAPAAPGTSLRIQVVVPADKTVGSSDRGFCEFHVHAGERHA